MAPASWLIQSDVDEGRGILNFSGVGTPQPDAGEVSEAVTEGSMPPLQYKLMHPSARLSDAERRDLAAGLERTYSSDPPAGVSSGG